MRYLENFLECILEELHMRLDGKPLEVAAREARELLETNLVDQEVILGMFLGELCECSRCGTAWRECLMEWGEDECRTKHFCMHCL